MALTRLLRSFGYHRAGTHPRRLLFIAQSHAFLGPRESQEELRGLRLGTCPQEVLRIEPFQRLNRGAARRRSRRYKRGADGCDHHSPLVGGNRKWADRISLNEEVDQILPMRMAQLSASIGCWQSASSFSANWLDATRSLFERALAICV
jgi:hypothetical protein